MALRSGQFLKMEFCYTYASDTDEEIQERLKAIKKKNKDEKIDGYAHYFQLLNGFESYLFMSAKEMEAHAKKYSQTYKNGGGLWRDSFDKMSKKTIIKQHLNSGDAPLSVEMRDAMKFDQAVTTDGETVDYPDNEPESFATEYTDEDMQSTFEEVKDDPKKAKEAFVKGEINEDLFNQCAK